MFRGLGTQKRLAAAVGLAALLALLGGWLLEPSSPLGNLLGRASYDSFYSWFDLTEDLPAPSPGIVVYLDLESYLSQHLDPAQPWPRQLHARLLDRLTTAGARAVLFDIVFDVPGADASGDQALAEAIRRNGRVLLAAELSASSQKTGAAEWGRSTRLALPAPAFLEAAAGWGLGDIVVDDDFMARRHFYGRSHDGEARPSLTWATAQFLNLTGAAPSSPAPSRWLRYYGKPFTLPHVSYRQTLDASAVGDELFRDKIVFIGARPMAGLFKERRDEFRSPFRSWRERDLFMPGVEVHATQMFNLLRGDWLIRLAPETELAFVLAVALLGAGLLWLRPVWAAAGTLALGALALGGAAVTFRHANLWFPWLVPVAGQLPVALGGAVLFHSLEWYRTRLRLEAAKRAADTRIREQAALLDKAHDAILVQDLSGRVLYLNPSAERLYGWKPRELQEAGAVAQFSSDDARLAEAHRAVTGQGEWQGELRQRTRAGQSLIVESRWTLIRDEAGRPKSLLLINTDVTEQRQLQAEALRLQRLEGIGALAGGMAHDLNNALAPILMGAQILRRDATDDETRRILSLMETSTRRGADMVRQVLLFARGREGEFQPLDLRPLVLEMDKLARETFPKSIQVAAYVADDLWPVRGNATQLHQVLLNLCVNARDAMPAGGSLSLAADNVVLSAAELVEVPGAKPGAYVSLLVSDTGTGISKEVLPRIFEPFFTTKAEGKGTGLGLSTTSRILKTHGGFISVQPGAEAGTTFEILLPRLEAAAAVEAAPVSAGAPRGHGELLLVADDEQAVREMLRRGLEDHGYRVATAANGSEAVSLFRQRASEVALVITDTSMPLMDGPTALAAMRELRADVRGLLMSGEEGLPASARPGSACLQKPFELAELLSAVARALESK